MNSPFRFDNVTIPPDRKIGMHTQSTWELALVIVGKGMRTIGKTTLPIEEGELILIPPGIPHFWDFDDSSTDSDGNISHIAIMVAPKTLDRLTEMFPELRTSINSITSSHDAVKIEGADREEISTLMRSMQGLSPLGRLPLMFKLLLLLGRVRSTTPVGTLTSMSAKAARLEKLRIYCVCNMTRKISLEEIAAHLGMNKSSFCTFVRRATGRTFTEYLNTMRLSKAADLILRDDCRISEIAYGVGFTSITYFNRLFRSCYGVSPTGYRVGH